MNLFDILGIKEAFQLPAATKAMIADEAETAAVLSQIQAAARTDDAFINTFQVFFSDRTRLKQDFTPSSVARLIAAITGSPDRLLDMCAGCGALSLPFLATSPDLVCDEYSEQAVAFLILVLAAKNANALIRHTDVLSGEVFASYRLQAGEAFSRIEVVENQDVNLFDTVVSNPPYSMPWQPWARPLTEGYAVPPKSKADFAFLLSGLSCLEAGGVMVAVLPHGILFRGGKESEIRQRLIEENLIHAVIGLPEKLFLNTDISVCLVVLKKNRAEKDVLFINAAGEYIKSKKPYTMTDGHIGKIADGYRRFADVERFARVAGLEEIRANGYNLNIPRYVDTTSPEPPIDLEEVVNDLICTQMEIDSVQRELLAEMKKLRCTNPAEQQSYDRAVAKFALFCEPPVIQTGDSLPLDFDADGLIAQTERKIIQFQKMKQYFLQKMMVNAK